MERMQDVAWIMEAVEKVLRREGKQGVRKDPGWFHPSNLSSTCDMALALSFLGHTMGDSIDGRTQRIFDLGNARDKAWKQYLKDAGLRFDTLWTDRLVRIEDWRIRGECDAVLRDDTAQQWVGEIKTINARGFGLLDGRPTREHRIQTTCYMVGLNIPRTMMIYECKDTQEVAFIPYYYDAAEWQAICERIAYIVQGLQDLHYFDKECRYGCKYADTCALYDPREALDKYRKIVGE